MTPALQSPWLHRYVHFLFLINPYNTIPKITVIDPAAIPTPISSITTFSFCAKSFSDMTLTLVLQSDYDEPGRALV